MPTYAFELRIHSVTKASVGLRRRTRKQAGQASMELGRIERLAQHCLHSGVVDLVIPEIVAEGGAQEHGHSGPPPRDCSSKRDAGHPRHGQIREQQIEALDVGLEEGQGLATTSGGRNLQAPTGE